jgi:hypothetical protein
MSLEKEATVRARLDGVDEVASGFNRIGQSGSSASSTIGGGFKAAGGAIKDAVQGVISDLGHVVTAAGAINFAGAVAQAHQFEDVVARMGAASRTSFRSVGEVVNDLSTEMNELPNVTAAWIQSVAKVTYGYQGAASAAKQAAEYGALTGQSVQEVQPLVVALEQMTGAAGKSGRAMEVLAGQARAFGREPKAIGDAVVQLSTQLEDLSGSAASKTALVSGFGGKKAYQNERQRTQGLGSILSQIESDPEGYERGLGLKQHSLTDEYGNVDATKALETLKKFGAGSKGKKFRLEQTFGRRNAAGIMDTDFAAIHDQESAAPATDAAEAKARYDASPAGQRKKNEVKKAQTMQDTVGADSLIGGISDWIGSQAATHPLLTGMGAAVGTKLAGKGVGALWGSIFGGGEAAAATGTGAATTGGGSGAGSLLLSGLGAGGMAAGGTLLGSILLAGKFLTDPLVSRGFRDDVDLTQRDARNLSAKAKAATDHATEVRSPGMQAAIDAEQRRQFVDRARRSGVHVDDLGGGLSDWLSSAAPSVAGALKGARAAMTAAPEASLPPALAAVRDHLFPAAARAPQAVSAEAAQARALVAELVKAGASLQLAQETAAKVLQAGGQPITIEVVNATGGAIDAMVRGEQ